MSLFRLPLGAWFPGRTVACALAATWLSTTASATTVVPMSLTALADYSGQVIVGEVSQVRSFWARDPRQILSEVTFGGVQYLKGATPESGDTFTLVVPGGTVDDIRMQLSCAPSFAVGEKWLLCLLPTYRTFPVAGVSQGAFRIVRDADGAERVYQELHQALSPITGIDARNFVQVRRRSTTEAHACVVGGVNSRVKAEAVPSGAPQAMSRDEFLDRLMPILQTSKDHQMGAPAGRRVPVRYRSVPLQQSAGQRPSAGGASVQPILRASRPTRLQVRPPPIPASQPPEVRP